MWLLEDVDAGRVLLYVGCFLLLALSRWLKPWRWVGRRLRNG